MKKIKNLIKKLIKKYFDAVLDGRKKLIFIPSVKKLRILFAENALARGFEDYALLAIENDKSKRSLKIKLRVYVAKGDLEYLVSHGDILFPLLDKKTIEQIVEMVFEQNHEKEIIFSLLRSHSQKFAFEEAALKSFVKFGQLETAKNFIEEEQLLGESLPNGIIETVLYIFNNINPHLTIKYVESNLNVLDNFEIKKKYFFSLILTEKLEAASMMLASIKYMDFEKPDPEVYELNYLFYLASGDMAKAYHFARFYFKSSLNNVIGLKKCIAWFGKMNCFHDAFLAFERLCKVQRRVDLEDIDLDDELMSKLILKSSRKKKRLSVVFNPDPFDEPNILSCLQRMRMLILDVALVKVGLSESNALTKMSFLNSIFEDLIENEGESADLFGVKVNDTKLSDDDFLTINYQINKYDKKDGGLFFKAESERYEISYRH